MIAGLRTAAATLRRDPRPVLAALLVLAQAVGAVGGPVAVRPGDSVRACGCPVRGLAAACCCSAGGCCDVRVVPEEPPCPKCLATDAAKPAAVVWLASVQARQCRGDSPLGLSADIPAVPPEVPAASVFTPPLSDPISPADQFATSAGVIPPDPPPRND